MYRWRKVCRCLQNSSTGHLVMSDVVFPKLELMDEILHCGLSPHKFLKHPHLLWPNALRFYFCLFLCHHILHTALVTKLNSPSLRLMWPLLCLPLFLALLLPLFHLFSFSIWYSSSFFPVWLFTAGPGDIQCPRAVSGCQLYL